MTFDPSQNMMLESLRLAWPERDPDDRPARILDHFGMDGRIHWRALQISDVVADFEEGTDR